MYWTAEISVHTEIQARKKIMGDPVQDPHFTDEEKEAEEGKQCIHMASQWLSGGGSCNTH